MTNWKAIRTLIIGAVFVAPVSAVHATVVDFTDRAWSGINGAGPYSIGTGVTLSSAGGNMTFNGSDGAAGCGNGGDAVIEGATGLACVGDGIGIGDDEITQKNYHTVYEAITVTFDGPVNVLGIDLLDLFPQETGRRYGEGLDLFGSTGEVAVLQWTDAAGAHEYNSHAVNVADYPGGGYWEIDLPLEGGLSMAGITSFTLKGFHDKFSDYSLARIEFSAVPVPAAFWMFGTALIGFVAMSRRTKV